MALLCAGEIALIGPDKFRCVSGECSTDDEYRAR